VIDLEACHLLKDTVEGEGEELLGERFAVALAALPVHHIVAVAPVLEHVWDKLRGILKVRIENDNDLALGLIKATGDSSLVPEVARQAHGLDEAILARV